MKRQIIYFLCIMVLVLTFVSCTNITNNSEQSKDVPNMQLEYLLSGKTVGEEVRHGTSSWTYENGDGTSTNTLTDSAHPLQAIESLLKIENIVEIEELKISFSKTPDSYMVCRWPDSCVGDNEAFENFEKVEVSDDTITVADDGQGYIYEVRATWVQGYAHYAFYITN